jgi:hypothetical protein
MSDPTEFSLPARHKVSSLCWDGDSLVDWVEGGHRYYLDGRVPLRNVAYSFPFDAAVVSPTCEYAAIFTRLGTKGLVLKRGEVLRELNRSFYHAHVYEYPITMLRLRNGREVIAHCPDSYNQLEIDDLETGARLTSAGARSPSDVFFSRLAATPDGSFLMSAGWVWHPLDHVKVFNIGIGLADPTHLDGGGIELDLWAEDSSACFLTGSRMVVALNDELDDEETPVGREGQGKKEESPEFGVFRIYDVAAAELLWSASPQAPVGSIMSVGQDQVVGFYEHPKLFDLRSGAVIRRWPHLKTGTQTSSIIWHIGAIPPMAFDTGNRRFAIAHDDIITVVQL